MAECLNCGAAEVGDFCPSCGQENAASIPGLGEWLQEIRDEYFVLDGKLPRTLAHLIFRPGHLTAAWISGRRARYLRPFRLFVVATPIMLVADFNRYAQIGLLMLSVPLLGAISFLVLERDRPRPSTVPHLVLSLHVHTVLLLGLLAVEAALRLGVADGGRSTALLVVPPLLFLTYVAATDRRAWGSTLARSWLRALLVLLAHGGVMTGVITTAMLLAGDT